MLIWLGRDDLRLKVGLIAMRIWAVLLGGILAFSKSPYLFVAARAVVDVVLILMIFGGDTRIRCMRER